MRAIECPNCKASLEKITSGQKHTVCSFCRTTIDLSDLTRDIKASSVELQCERDEDPWLEKGFIFLEEREWEVANRQFRTVLHDEPKSAQAYLGLLLAELQLTNEEELENYATPLSDLSENINYRMLMRFADDALRQRLEGYNEAITQRINEKAEIKRQENELFQDAAENLGCVAGYLIPLLISIPITVIIAEIWYLIFRNGFHLVNLRLFRESYRFGIGTFLGLGVTWFVIFALAVGGRNEIEREKIKAERSNKE